jgi:thiamine transport system permease protein
MDRRGNDKIIAGLFLALPLSALGIGVVLPFMQLFKVFFSHLGLGNTQELHFSYLAAIVQFSLWQASVSTAASLAIAGMLAYVCAYYRFRGKKMLLALGQLPFFIPSLIVAFAFVLVYGQNGWCNQVLLHLGASSPFPFLYNRWAIVAAHIFFNVAFLARTILSAFWEIPSVRHEWALAVGLPWWKKLYYIDWAYVKRPLINGGLLTFILCLNSFPIIMVLGGGIKNTTAEVGIYQFLHADFDLYSAITLSFVQLSITLLASLCYRLPPVNSSTGSLPLASWQKQQENLSALQSSSLGWLFRLFLGCLALFLFLPLVAIIVDGIFALLSFPLSWGDFCGLVCWPLLNSLIISGGTALGATSLAVATCFGLYYLAGFSPRWARVLERALYVLLGISPIVLSLAYYIFLQGEVDFSSSAWGVIIAVQGLGALPFEVKILLPAVIAVKKNCEKFECVIGLSFWRGFVAAELPGLLPAIGAALLSGFALSLGNLSVIAMFSQSGIETIPLLIYRLMGVYRYQEAALISAAFVLLFLPALLLMRKKKYALAHT